MYFEELLQLAKLTADTVSEDEIVLLPKDCRPHIDKNLVVSRSDFEAVLMKYRTVDPTSEAVLMTIGRTGITLGDPLWTTMLQIPSVLDKFTALCNDEAVSKLEQLDESAAPVMEPRASDIAEAPVFVPDVSEAPSVETSDDGVEILFAPEEETDGNEADSTSSDFGIPTEDTDSTVAENEAPAEFGIPTDDNSDDTPAEFGIPTDDTVAEDTPAEFGIPTEDTPAEFGILTEDTPAEFGIQPDDGEHTSTTEFGIQPDDNESVANEEPAEFGIQPDDTEDTVSEGPAEFGIPTDDTPAEFGIPTDDTPAEFGIPTDDTVSEEPAEFGIPVEESTDTVDTAIIEDTPAVSESDGMDIYLDRVTLFKEYDAEVRDDEPVEEIGSTPAQEEAEQGSEGNDAVFGVDPDFGVSPAFSVSPDFGVDSFESEPASAEAEETPVADDNNSCDVEETSIADDNNSCDAEEANEDIENAEVPSVDTAFSPDDTYQQYDMQGYAPTSDTSSYALEEEATAEEVAEVPAETAVDENVTVEETATVEEVGQLSDEEMERMLQFVNEAFNTFNDAVKQYTLTTILGAANMDAEQFCNKLVEQFPQFDEQLNSSLKLSRNDYDCATMDLVQLLKLEAESALYRKDSEYAENCVAPVCELIYD